MAPVRYAVRQVLDQELVKEKILQNSAARQARAGVSHLDIEVGKENVPIFEKVQEAVATKTTGGKRDFFGRVILESVNVNETRPNSSGAGHKSSTIMEEGRIWVSFHEGFSNAVRKPITLKEFLDGF